MSADLAEEKLRVRAPLEIVAVGTSCFVRLRNEDIETLYQMVSVGTPVFIY